MTTLADLIVQRNELDKLIEIARKKERNQAISRVTELISQYQLSAQECGFCPKPEKLGTMGRKAVAIKYRTPDGKSWTGRGKTPRWIIEYESNGNSREDFRI